MIKFKIVVEKRDNNNWIAYTEHNPDIWEVADTKVKALGELIITLSDAGIIELEEKEVNSKWK